MHVTITGAAGFIGQSVIKRLAKHGTIAGPEGEHSPIENFALLDVSQPAFVPSNGEVWIGDVSDPEFVSSAIKAETTHLFHLAAVVSGQAEADFDLGMLINVDATRLLLDKLRSFSSKPRFVFPSSLAVFGHAPKVIKDDTAALPSSSYGAQKAMAELLINDMSRKGYVEGVSVRVPTVIVRPGKPNAAASSFASSIIREPMAGQRAICPVSADLKMWVSSPDTVTNNLIQAANLPTAALGFPRMINLPGLSISVAEMIDAAARAGADTQLISHEPDAAIEAIVSTWPEQMETVRANRLGFLPNPSIDAIVSEHRELVANG